MTSVLFLNFHPSTTQNHDPDMSCFITDLALLKKLHSRWNWPVLVYIFALLSVNNVCEGSFNVIGALIVFYFELYILNKFIPYRPLKINIFFNFASKYTKRCWKKHTKRTEQVGLTLFEPTYPIRPRRTLHFCCYTVHFGNVSILFTNKYTFY
jgi:hypothetical protein